VFRFPGVAQALHRNSNASSLGRVVPAGVVEASVTRSWSLHLAQLQVTESSSAAQESGQGALVRRGCSVRTEERSQELCCSVTLSGQHSGKQSRGRRERQTGLKEAPFSESKSKITRSNDKKHEAHIIERLPQHRTVIRTPLAWGPVSPQAPPLLQPLFARPPLALARPTPVLPQRGCSPCRPHASSDNQEASEREWATGQSPPRRSASA
jgi:hypothetical protein